MPSIIIRRDGKPTKEVVLDKGFTLIGRKADADIKIEDADEIEERASILQVGDEFILNELSPSDGTFVNGQPIKKRVLKDRDLITIGEYRMTFQDKRESDKPVGIEMEVAEARPRVDMARRPGKVADPFRAGPGEKSKLVTYVVLAAIVVGICFASYQSYLERQAADVQAALANKAYQESKRKEAENFQENARAVGSSMKRTESPAETPVTEQKH